MHLEFLGPKKSKGGFWGVSVMAKNNKNEKIGYVFGRVRNNRLECEYAVEPNSRRQGVATSMLEFMLEKVFIDEALEEVCPSLSSVVCSAKPGKWLVAFCFAIADLLGSVPHTAKQGDVIEVLGMSVKDIVCLFLKKHDRIQGFHHF